MFLIASCANISFAQDDQLVHEDTCFQVLFDLAKEWADRDSFIVAIAHYDAARACPDASKDQDAMARERANDARLKWQEQLYSQIIIAQKAKEDALKSAIRADSARLVAIQKELDAQRARREAVRNARGSEAGRLALLADDETDILISENSDDRERMQDALYTAYWGMRWAGDTIIPEVARAFGNAVYLNLHREYSGPRCGALGLAFDESNGQMYQRSYSGDIHTYVRDGWISALQHDAFSADMLVDSASGIVLSAGWNQMTVWDASGRSAGSEGQHSVSQITTVAYSPESGLRAFGGRTGELYLSDGNDIHSMTGHNSHITDVAFAKDGTRLVTAARDKKIILWDAEGQMLASTAALNSYIRGIMVMSRDRLIAASGNTLNIFALKDDKLNVVAEIEHPGTVTDFCYFPNGRIITTCIDGTVRLWSSTGEMIKSSGDHGGPVHGVHILAENKCVSWSGNGNIAIWDSNLDNRAFLKNNHQGDLRDLVVSPMGNYFITIGNDRTIRLMDHMGITWMTPPSFTEDVWSAGFNPSETMVWASTSENQVEKVWTCVMPTVQYQNLLNEDAIPTSAQMARFNMKALPVEE